MFQERDGEKEILLGNKQLLAIFFVLAILFGVFFTAGYMVGRTTGDKKPTETAVEARSAPADSAQASGGETHSVSPEPGSTSQPGAAAARPTDQTRTAESKPAIKPKPELTRAEEEQEPASDGETTAPPGHSTYLQVAALHRADAETVAKVLAKKGFRAHISPKAGTPYYRVLVGPVHDAGELNSTRDALKSKGFREVFVQHL